MHSPDREHVRDVAAADVDRVLGEHELAQIIGRVREEPHVREVAESAETLVAPDDPLGSVAHRGRHVQHARPLLARQRQDMPEQRPRLLERVASAADGDDLRLGHYSAAARTAAS